jgi:MEDS: MEthanogen/methylotroph, DcmR Sensory domain
MGTNRSSVQCAGGSLGRHRHVCAFFNSVDEEHRVLGTFVKDGFDRGDKAFHIVDPDRWEDHLGWLAEAGVDVEQATGTGQLELRRWQDAYLRGDRFDQDAMLALIEEVLQSGTASGYPLTRLIGGTGWSLLDKPGVGDLVEYETRLNYVLAKYDDPVICTYDLSKFGASVVMDIMRTHPIVIIGGVLQENPFFVPPDQFLLELRARGRSARAQ